VRGAERGRAGAVRADDTPRTEACEAYPQRPQSRVQGGRAVFVRVRVRVRVRVGRVGAVQVGARKACVGGLGTRFCSIQQRLVQTLCTWWCGTYGERGGGRGRGDWA
jgi:hypothetical protein